MIVSNNANNTNICNTNILDNLLKPQQKKFDSYEFPQKYQIFKKPKAIFKSFIQTLPIAGMLAFYPLMLLLVNIITETIFFADKHLETNRFSSKFINEKRVNLEKANKVFFDIPNVLVKEVTNILKK